LITAAGQQARASRREQPVNPINLDLAAVGLMSITVTPPGPTVR
jgi:hypothetical protein